MGLCICACVRRTCLVTVGGGAGDVRRVMHVLSWRTPSMSLSLTAPRPWGVLWRQPRRHHCPAMQVTSDATYQCVVLVSQRSALDEASLTHLGELVPVNTSSVIDDRTLRHPK